jgi:copper homeostasis protein
MQDRILMESPVYTVEAAIAAQGAGVDRIELCADFGEGGVTPSSGMLIQLKKHLEIPIFVMIRPRGGDFLYNMLEYSIMKEDILLMKEHGAGGFVFGLLDPLGRVDEKRCEELVNLAAPLPCTFHRAIDVSCSLLGTMEQAIDCGFKRILSSGGKPTVGEGLQGLLEMQEKAGDRIIVMPGGGMDPGLINTFLQKGNLREFHASCKMRRPSYAEFIHEEVSLSGSGEKIPHILTIDASQVLAYKDALIADGST